MAKFKKGSAAAKAYMAKLRAAKGKKKPTIKKSAVKKSTTKKVGEVYYYGEGKKISTGRLVVGEKYEWILGAGYQEVIYIGLTSKNPNYRAGSRLGNGGYLFKWVEDGSYVDLSAVAVLQSIRTIPNKSVGKTKTTSRKTKTPVSKHKDTKSHNVNIKVVSGTEVNIGNITIDQIKRNHESIERLTKVLLENKEKMKLFPYKTIFWQNYFKQKNKEISEYIKTLKKQNTSLKRHIK